MENCTKLVQNKIKNTPKTKYDAQDTSVSWLLARYSLLSYTPFTLTPEISKTKVLLLHSPVVAHKTWKWNTIPTPLDSDFEWPHARLPPDFFQDPIREMCIPKLNIFPPPPPSTHTHSSWKQRRRHTMVYKVDWQRQADVDDMFFK